MKARYEELLNKLKNIITVSKEKDIIIPPGFIDDIRSIETMLKEDLSKTMEYTVTKGTSYAISYINNCYKKAFDALNEAKRKLENTENIRKYYNSLLDDIKKIINDLEQVGIEVTDCKIALNGFLKFAEDKLSEPSENDEDLEFTFAVLNYLEDYKIMLEKDKENISKMSEEEKEAYKNIYKLSSYNSSISSKINDVIEKYLERESIKTTRNLTKGKIAKSTLKSVLSGLLIAGILSGSYMIGKMIERENRKYKTKKTAYSTITGDEKTEEMYLNTLDTKDKAYVLEVMPYTYDDKVPMISYNVTDFENMSIEELLNLDFEKLGIEGKLVERPATDMETLYYDTYYLVEKYIIDENDFKEDKQYALLTILIIILGIELSMLIEGIYYTIGLNNTFLTRGWKPLFIKEIKEIINYSKELKESKKTLKEEQEKIEYLRMLVKKFFTEHKSEVDEMIKSLENVKNNPKFQAHLEYINELLTDAHVIESFMTNNKEATR